MIVGHGALVSVLLRRRVEVEPVVDVDLGAGRHAADDADDLVVLLTELRTKVRENFTITEKAPTNLPPLSHLRHYAQQGLTHDKKMSYWDNNAMIIRDSRFG